MKEGTKVKTVVGKFNDYYKMHGVVTRYWFGHPVVRFQGENKEVAIDQHNIHLASCKCEMCVKIYGDRG